MVSLKTYNQLVAFSKPKTLKGVFTVVLTESEYDNVFKIVEEFDTTFNFVKTKYGVHRPRSMKNIHIIILLNAMDEFSKKKVDHVVSHFSANPPSIKCESIKIEYATRENPDSDTLVFTELVSKKFDLPAPVPVEKPKEEKKGKSKATPEVCKGPSSECCTPEQCCLKGEEGLCCTKETSCCMKEVASSSSEVVPEKPAKKKRSATAPEKSETAPKKKKKKSVTDNDDASSTKAQCGSVDLEGPTKKRKRASKPRPKASDFFEEETTVQSDASSVIVPETPEIKPEITSEAADTSARTTKEKKPKKPRAKKPKSPAPAPATAPDVGPAAAH